MIQEWVLENGAHILLDSVKTTGMVSAAFWFLCGSRDERDLTTLSDDNGKSSDKGVNEKGLTHFLEHMLFKGTEKRTAYQIAREIDRVGGIINAFTEREDTCFYVTLPAEHLELGIDVLADMIFNSTFDPVEIEKEKSVIDNEILSLMDSPEELAHEAYLGGLWGKHPLARKITGDVEDIRSIDRNMLVRFCNERFVPSNLVVSVAGRFDPQKFKDNIVRILDGMRGSSLPLRRSPPKRRRFWASQSDRFKQVQIYTGTDLQLGRGEHAALYDAQVFSIAVGESMSSRLFQAIREEKALCYSVTSFRTLFTDTSLWTIYGNTSPDLVSPFLSTLNDELKRFSTRSLSNDEIDDAKSHLRGGITMSKEDMEIRMKRLVRLHSLVGKVIDYEQSLSFIEGVNRTGVMRITEELIRGENYNLLVYGGEDETDLEELRFTF